MGIIWRSSASLKWICYEQHSRMVWRCTSSSTIHIQYSCDAWQTLSFDKVKVKLEAVRKSTHNRFSLQTQIFRVENLPITFFFSICFFYQFSINEYFRNWLQSSTVPFHSFIFFFSFSFIYLFISIVRLLWMHRKQYTTQKRNYYKQFSIVYFTYDAHRTRWKRDDVRCSVELK